MVRIDVAYCGGFGVRRCMTERSEALTDAPVTIGQGEFLPDGPRRHGAGHVPCDHHGDLAEREKIDLTACGSASRKRCPPSHRGGFAKTLHPHRSCPALTEPQKAKLEEAATLPVTRPARKRRDAISSCARKACRPRSVVLSTTAGSCEKSFVRHGGMLKNGRGGLFDLQPSSMKTTLSATSLAKPISGDHDHRHAFPGEVLHDVQPSLIQLGSRAEGRSSKKERAIGGKNPFFSGGGPFSWGARGPPPPGNF